MVIVTPDHKLGLLRWRDRPVA